MMTLDQIKRADELRRQLDSLKSLQTKRVTHLGYETETRLRTYGERFIPSYELSPEEGRVILQTLIERKQDDLRALGVTL